MTGIDTFVPPAPPRPSALQRAWLREIGIDKVWGAPPAPKPAATQVSAGETRTAPPAAAVAPASQTPPAPPPARAPSSADANAARQAAAAARQALMPGKTGRSAAAPAAPAMPQSADTAAAVAGADLAQLREMVVGCTACGLCHGRKQAVFGTGAPAARWLVVGEAPGEQEDRKGEPFVGRSGQLLDAMLASVGMSRDKDVFIANVIKCRPPGNRNPKPEEIAACSPYLLRQITLLKPERILVVGRFAAQTLLQTEASIASLRGRVHHLDAPDGRRIPLVVSYHPAYLLRSPLEKARAWQDLQLAVTLDKPAG
ncbi:uracil-DNA glycosylase [Orrella dioscoreae]|uniref:Type-4 uracil-DNA glycosylase n=2 Tax=root TaxID=1 RepID=A0A1C3K7L6_9BURK|nr:uracil-DNA glycosylase [Orrella dioscoreae]SBT27408.1 Uracil-DNA glycosylase, family 4 [Orrella dioscoreae]SOE48327.1 Uracil-DNA glycosylase, family 4 [Orrella dioscoreae]